MEQLKSLAVELGINIDWITPVKLDSKDNNGTGYLDPVAKKQCESSYCFTTSDGRPGIAIPAGRWGSLVVFKHHCHNFIVANWPDALRRASGIVVNNLEMAKANNIKEVLNWIEAN